jgi:hypothetical protein
MSFLTSICDWFVNSLGWIWLTIFFVAIAAELFWLYVVVIRAWDIRYDPERADKLKSGRLRRKRINLDKARRRRVSVPYYGVPMLAGWVFAMVVLFMHPSWTTYLVVATLCLITSPLQEVWLIGVARRIKTKTNKQLDKSFRNAIRGYYSSGLSLPDSKHPEPWFEDRLAWLNFFQKFHYLLHAFRFWGLGAEALGCLCWPVLWLVAVFDRLDKVEAYDERTPWWRLDRATRTF